MASCGGEEKISLQILIHEELYTGPSLCAQDILIAPLCFVVFVLFAGFRVRKILTIPQTHDYIDPSFWTKATWNEKLQLLNLIILALFPVACIFLLQSGDPTASRQTTYYIIQSLLWTMNMILVVLEMSRDLGRGPQLKLFWMLIAAVLLIRVRVASLILVYEGLTVEDSHSVADIIYFVLALSIMMLGLLQVPVSTKTQGASTAGQEGKYGMFVDSDDGDAIKKQFVEGGERSASWLSKLTFAWLSQLLKLGWSQQLKDSDLCPLIPEDTMEETGRILLQAWNAEMLKQQQDPKRKSPLFRSLAAVFWPQVLMGACYKIINDLVVFTGPMLLQQLIRFVESGDANSSIADGAFIAIGIFLSKTVESLVLGQYFDVGYRLGSQVRSGVTSLVYRKAFLLSAKGRQDFKLGELVSLMSVDAQRLCGTCPYLHQFWSAPIQLFVSIGLLYRTMGPSVFAGVVLMIVLIPVNTKISKIQSGINREFMKLKDQRANKMDEVLQGIRIIKYFAWERSFRAGISEVRKKEMELIWRNSVWGIVSMSLFAGTPMLVTLITFSVYTVSGQDLKPNVAFTALALFNVMRFPLMFLPMVINFIIESRVALKRLSKYLRAEEVEREYYANSDHQASAAGAEGVELVRISNNSGPAVKIVNASFSWAKSKEVEKKVPEDKGGIIKKVASILKSDSTDNLAALEDDCYSTVLRNISVEVKPGELCMVCGPVGSGKSSFLGALLGETKREEGSVLLSGKVAYAAQQPWIMNATVKDNILFGIPFNEERYQQVVSVCALTQDMQVLPAGDMTEIGEKGINLSGGQKARISLARAVYQDADVYMLDDPLSAVDVHVSKHIFDECVVGFLASKTRILVTHQIKYLPRADSVLVIDKGTITANGDFDTVVKSHPHLFVEGSQESAATKQKSLSEQTVHMPQSSSIPSKTSNGMSKTDSEMKPSGPGRTTTNEARQRGTIPLRVWKTYAYSMGIWLCVSLFAAYIMSQFLNLLSDAEVGFWSTDMVQHEQQVAKAIESGTEMPPPVNVYGYLGIYCVLTLLTILSVSVRSGAVSLGCFRAAAKLHDDMLATVIRAPVSFFDTTPTGRILNRFSSDQYAVDNDLRQNVSMLLMCILRVAFVAVVILYVTPFFVVVVIPLGYIYFKVQKFYRESSRELKRLESVAKSPIFAQFSETISGIATIRAFNSQARFTTHSDDMNDKYTRAYYCNNASNRWLAVRLEFIGNVAVGCASLFAVIWNGHDPSSAGMVGLSVVYALEVTGTLNWAIRTFTQLESNMVAVERLDEYTRVPTEKADIVESNRPPGTWPQHGVLSFDNVQMRYREGLSLALKGITFTTKPGEKIGVVGRTGAGKSSLAVALFRISEICGGRITLDGIDISEIGLADLRTKLSIIPQDPMLFAGTIRSNLDPFDEFTDSDIWDALEKVHMKEFLRDKEEGVRYAVTEGGTNLSVGQRQLMCMARALLRKAKIIIMDEATASVDMQTDEAIQETIREGFRASTVITIAHRLATVMACDRIMVLGEGRVLEIGSPDELSNNPTGVFRAMTHDTESTEEMLK